MRLTTEIANMDPLSPVETRGIGMLLFAEAGRLGMCVDPAPSSRAKAALAEAAEKWLVKVESNLRLMPPGAPLRLFMFFDFLHRIVRGRPTAPALRNECARRAFRALGCGDASVCPYDLFSFLSSAPGKGDASPCDASLLRWRRGEVARWLGDFSSPAASDRLPLFDILRRASALMRADLPGLDVPDGEAVREMLRRRYRPLVDKLTAPSAEPCGCDTYLALGEFLRELRGDIGYADFARYEAGIHAAIIAAPDADRFTREYYKDCPGRCAPPMAPTRQRHKNII